MLHILKLSRSALIVLISFTVLYPSASTAYFVNTANFFGSNPASDAEAEYRLLELARAIVDTRIADGEASIAVKQMYGAGNMGSATPDLVYPAMAALANAQEKWLSVAYHISNTRVWLMPRVRPEYAQAYCQAISSPDEFQTLMISRNTGSELLLPEYKLLGEGCSGSADPMAAIDAMFASLEAKAKIAADAAAAFKASLFTTARRAEDAGTGIYGIIYQELALGEKKPDFYSLDKSMFIAVTGFYLAYEAMEQVTREAHLIDTGEHDTEIKVFSGPYTAD